MFHLLKGYGFLDTRGEDPFITPQTSDSYGYEVGLHDDGRAIAINMAKTLDVESMSVYQERYSVTMARDRALFARVFIVSFTLQLLSLVTSLIF